MEVLFGDTAVGHALMTLISFGLLIFVVQKFAYQPIMNILNERKEAIRNDMNAAHEASTLSNEANANAQQLLINAQTEANQLMADARKQSQILTVSLQEKAQQDIEAMHHEAKDKIANERRQLITEMEESVSVVSIEVAEKIIQREVKEADHRSLINQFIQRLDAEVSHES